MLLARAPAAQQQRTADHAAKNNHDDGKQHITHQRGIVLAIQHDGGNAHHFDGGHRQRQNKRAIGLAEDFCDLVCVPHDREGGAERNGEQQKKMSANPNGLVSSSNSASPKMAKMSVIAKLRPKNHSFRTA